MYHIYLLLKNVINKHHKIWYASKHGIFWALLNLVGALFPHMKPSKVTIYSGKQCDIELEQTLQFPRLTHTKNQQFDIVMEWENLLRMKQIFLSRPKSTLTYNDLAIYLEARHWILLVHKLQGIFELFKIGFITPQLFNSFYI